MLKFTAFCNLLLLQKQDQSSLGFPCSSRCQILPYFMPKYFLLVNICWGSYSPCFLDLEVMNLEGLTNKINQKYEYLPSCLGQWFNLIKDTNNLCEGHTCPMPFLNAFYLKLVLDLCHKAVLFIFFFSFSSYLKMFSLST